MRIFSLLLFVSVLTLFSCANEFELNAPYKDITVVYGFIDKDDPVHYIRIEKAFIDDETSALEIAKNPDSLYHDNVLVELVRLDKDNETITLERINGDDVGLPREEGLFADSPNILYGFSLPDDNKLEGEERVELRVSLGDEKEAVTGETMIIGGLSFLNGKPATSEIKWVYDAPTSIIWRTAAGQQVGEIFDVILNINIQELDPDNGEFIDRSLEWVIQRNIRKNNEGESSTGVRILGESFYLFLRDQLANEPRRQRFFRSIDVSVIAGGEELVTFLDISQANTGITSAQEIPSFTNLNGDAVGLFTSRKTTTIEVASLEKNTRDSLRSGIYTKDLNFQ